MFCFMWRLCGPAYLAAGPFITASCRYAFLFGHPKRKRKRCPLLAIAREARLRGLRGCEQGTTVERSETGERAMFAPAGRITARAGLRSKLAAIVLAAKRSPLRTPKLWSKAPKAKKCRKDCIFLNAFGFFSILTPSGPRFSMRNRGCRGEQCSPAAVCHISTFAGEQCSPLPDVYLICRGRCSSSAR